MHFDKPGSPGYKFTPGTRGFFIELSAGLQLCQFFGNLKVWTEI